jgi:tetratricopeptide (TPR) repeat protein
MKKSVIIIGLFLLGTAFSVHAQEMTEKEKFNYAIGVILGEKLKEEIQKSGIDMSIIESIKEKLKGRIDFESFKEGFRDISQGESKLSKEEIGAIFAELEKQINSYKKLIEANQKKGSEEKGNSCNSATYLTILATNHGQLSWYYLFINDYAQSEQSALRALELDDTQIWVKTNLAHALLFQNRFSEAEKIYKELSLHMRGNVPYSQVLLEDFDELEKAGVIPEKHKADVEKIRKMLRE